jgi:hypothetical protein
MENTLTEEDIEYIQAAFTYDPETGVVERVRARLFEARNSRGWADKQGYLRFSHCQGRTLAAHRIALVLSGQSVNKMQVDHINGDTKDNRLANLRLTSAAVNMRNAKRSRRNISGVTGVCWHRTARKWQASVYDAYLSKHLGYFDDFFEAVCARKSADNRLGYHPNHGRR